MASKTRTSMRVIRHQRLRKRITGTAEKPRLSVYRSTKHLSAQIIDDVKGHTIASVSTQEKGLEAGDNKEGAKKLGAALAARAKELGVTKVVFDRGGYMYHGSIASLADGAREGGLEF